MRRRSTSAERNCKSASSVTTYPHSGKGELMQQRSWEIGRAIAVGILLILATSAFAQQRAPEEPRQGGTLIVAMASEPDNLDPMKVTRSDVPGYTMLMVEGLFHIDAEGQPQPHLVDHYDVSADGLSYTFTLRSGIRFHDGQPLTVQDVLASYERWINWGQGREVADVVTQVEAVDDLTFVLTVSEPYPLLVSMMAIPAGTGLYVYPKSVIDEIGLADMQSAVGTGPFVFDRWQRGSVLRVKRNVDYQARTEPTSGYAGDQTPWVDFIEYRLIPDAAVRLAGIESGEFDFAHDIPSDFYESVLSNPSLRAIRMVGAPLFIQIDRSYGLTPSGWTGNQRFRQALSLALDKHQLAATLGHPDFSSADDCNLAVPPAWRTDICQERYHDYDPERARQILEEIGYNGEQLTYVTNPSREPFFNPALLAVQMLREVGINIELLPVDAATLLEMREQPRTWDLISGGHSAKLDPTLWSPALPDHFGWFGAYPEQLSDLLGKLRTETDPAIRIALWEEYTDFWYEWVPMIKIADQYTMHVENVRYSGVNLPGSGIYMNHNAGWK